MYHRAEDVKAHSPRSEASRPKQAKAAVRAQNGAAKPPPAKKAPPMKAAAPAKSALKPVKMPLALKPPPAKSATALKVAAPAKAAAPTKLAAPTKAAASVKAAVPVKAAAPGKGAAANATPAKGKATKAAVATPAVAVAPKKPARKSIKEAAGVSTDAVARRTGKTWDDWFAVLDNAGAATLDQRGIIAILAQKHGIGPWWQQMIAVGYESLRGAAEKPPAVDGFQISSSCTLDAPLTRVFRLWNDSGERARWLADDRFVVRASTADKVIRARWGKGSSHVAVSFAEKAGRTEVSVEHHQIESRGAAEQMKAYWAKKLGLLDQALVPRR
jgi:hypothetical protein